MKDVDDCHCDYPARSPVPPNVCLSLGKLTNCIVDGPVRTGDFGPLYSTSIYQIFSLGAFLGLGSIDRIHVFGVSMVLQPLVAQFTRVHEHITSVVTQHGGVQRAFGEALAEPL